MKLKNPNLFILSVIFLIVGFTMVRAEKNPALPPPYATTSAMNMPKVVGWPVDKTPVAPEGFVVSTFADIESPRALYVLPSGDVLVSQAKKTPMDSGEKSPDQITLFKVKNGMAVSRSVFAHNFHLPFGMALSRNKFFVAEAERVVVFDYQGGQLTAPAKTIATLPFAKPQRHWTRYLLVNSAGTKLYVAVGSVSNVGESPDPLDPRNAAILEMNLDGTEQKILARGLRNPVSMDWEPSTGRLWTVVNERDELGDDLVPDYITHVVEGGFYGWPYAYWGHHEDPRQKGVRPDLVQKTLTPDYSLGSHVSGLGIVFTAKTSVPSPFDSGALITEHGSWNRSSLVGYKVVYVPFRKGKPSGPERDFLSGFIADQEKSKVYGRPVAVAVLHDGSVLVSDDGGGKIWRVSKH
jgi:glucose/arabinose dehydrogenase